MERELEVTIMFGEEADRKYEEVRSLFIYLFWSIPKWSYLMEC